MSIIRVSTLMKEGYRTEVQCSKPFVIDQPLNAGGTDEGPNPLEVYLASVPACISAIARIMAIQRKIELNSIEIHAEGDIDKRYLLGRTTEGRAGYTEIRLFVKIDADMTEEEKLQFFQEAEARCPIADTTQKSTKIIATLE